jgi:transcriptional regulator with XRE-family HTH domain
VEYFHRCKWNYSLLIIIMEFEQRLRAVMAGLTIEEFARLIDEPAQRVKDVLRKKQKPPSDFLVKLQLQLGVDLNWLLAGGPEPPRALTAREAALLNDYRAAAEDGRRAIEATSSAVSKSVERAKQGRALEKTQKRVGRKAA